MTDCKVTPTDLRKLLADHAAEVKHLTAALAERDVEVAAAVVENDRLRAGFSEAIKKLNKSAFVRAVSCSWCGEHWPQLDGDTPDVARQHAREHAFQCESHPLRIERDQLRGEVERLTRESAEKTSDLINADRKAERWRPVVELMPQVVRKLSFLARDYPGDKETRGLIKTIEAVLLVAASRDGEG